MKILPFLFATLFITTSLLAQNGKVSSKTGIKKGVLKNGFTYYIYQNPAAQGKVDFYLLQNVGAILEEDSQNGLAHFLEHMFFNGTKNFPGNSIMEKFSAKSLTYNINAFTGVDQTVYQMTQVPSNDRAFLDECLFIMYDWCHNATLEYEKIEAERPVILEEMRTRNNLEFRINQQTAPALYNHSKYATHNIIGPAELIKNFEHKELFSLYETWYRPDLQAAIIIGDIDPIETETKIQNLFSTLAEMENPKERYHVSIPDNEETFFTEVRDPEIKHATVKVLYRHRYNENEDANYTATLLNQMLQKRAAKLLKNDKDTDLNEEESLLYVNMAFAPIVYGYANYGIAISYKEGKAEEALNMAFGMQKDILENGFTTEEFERAKNTMLESLNRLKDAHGRMPNKYIYENIRRNFINKTDINDPKTDLKNFENFIETLTLADLKATLNEWHSGPNKSIIVLGGTEMELISEQQILDFEAHSSPLSVIPDDNDEEENESNADHLMAGELKGADIVETKKWSDFLAEKWVLENGATVIYQECNTNPDVINIYASSPGGMSVLSGENRINGTNFQNFTPAFGIDGYTREQFENLLKTNEIAASPRLTQNEEEYFLMTRYAHIETAFQVLYSQFTNPVIYTDKFDEIYEMLGEKVKKAKPTHLTMLNDTLGIMRYGKERYQVIDSNWVQSISAKTMETVYNDRFQDAGNFTFYIVGGVGKSKAKKLAQQYIGSIPSTGRNEKTELLVNQLPQGRTQRTYAFEIPGKQAGVIYSMEYAAEYTFKNQLCFTLMQSYLQEKLNDEIRQKQRGTYGVKVQTNFDQLSTKNALFDIRFECDPVRAKELDEILHATTVSLCENGISPTDFDIVKKKFDKPQRPPLKNNMYCINILKDYAQLGTNADVEDYFKTTLDSIDRDYMNQCLKNLVENAAILDLIYLPEE